MYSLRGVLIRSLLLNEEGCRRWSASQHLDFTLPTRLAHLILPTQKCRSSGYLPRPCLSLLPRPSEDEETWRAFVEWRHPLVDLNLLQLAIIFKDWNVVEFLWEPVFLNEENYRDEFSKLVNYPVHLCKIVGISGNKFSLDHIRDELFYEEGLVDLTTSRLQGLPSRPDQEKSNPSSPSSPSASGQSSHSSDVSDNPLLQLGLSEKSASLLCPSSVKLCPLEINGKHAVGISELSNVLLKLGGPCAKASSVELAWAMITDLSSLAETMQSLTMYTCLGMPETWFKEEVLILSCQLLRVPQNMRPTVLYMYRLQAGDFMGVNINTALRFVPTWLAMIVISEVEKLETRNKRDGKTYAVPLVSEVMKDLLKKRSLQDLCVLAIMEAVRGDARKVWSLEELPEPLKQLFHVPFKAKYEELKALEQR